MMQPDSPGKWREWMNMRNVLRERFNKWLLRTPEL
jgi:hypothetical protein